MFKGEGDFKGVIAEWEKLKQAFESAEVLQDAYLGAPTSIRFTEEDVIIEFNG